MLGRPGNCEPVCTNVTPGPWLIASVCMLLMKHKSSATDAVCGSSSDNHAPLLPCCLNLNGDPASGSDDWLPDIPVGRCPMRTLSGSSVPCFLTSIGLGSKRSSCEGAPDMNRKITRFAFGA